MEHQERFERALRSSNPQAALDSLVLELSAEGYKKAEIYNFFNEFWASVQDQNRACDATMLENTMDALTGYCAPEFHLLPNEDIQQFGHKLSDTHSTG